jgi:MYXO-CTERM domain-containing protein
MRHFTIAAAGLALAAASPALAVDVSIDSIQGGLRIGKAEGYSVGRNGRAVCYSSLGLGMNTPFSNFTGFGFSQDSNGADPGGTSYVAADDIYMNKPGGTRVDEITFSVVNFNSDGNAATSGGSHTFTALVGIFNNDPLAPSGLAPDFNSPKGTIAVSGTVAAFTVNLFTLDVKDLNIIKKDEVIWAALVYTAAGAAPGTGPNTNGETFIENMGQGIFGPATKGFSDDLYWRNRPGFTGLFFFGGDPYANFGWEFRSVPTPGALALFGLAGAAAARRRR